MTRSAIIFSKNENISRLVKNELLLAGIDVRAVKSPTSDTESDGALDFLIVDLTSIEASDFAAIRSSLSKNAAAVKISISDSEESLRASWGFNKHLSFPFSLEELRSILIAERYDEENCDAQNSAKAQKCFFTDKSRTGVMLNGIYIPLSPYEFDTLELLCRNSGKCVERAQILEALNSTDGNISVVYISHLRNKLEHPFGLKIIYTVRSKGYMTDYTMGEQLS